MLKSPVPITVLLIIYYILTMMFPHTGIEGDRSGYRIIPQTIMGFIGIYSICIWLCNFSLISRNKIFKPFIILAIFGLLYIVYIKPYNSLDYNFIYTLKANMALFVMFALYPMLKYNFKKTKKCIFSIYAIQLIYAFYTLISDKLSNIHDTFDSNAGFILICCIPLALLLPNKRIRLYIFLSVVMGCLYSGQRSAALAAVLCFPFCFSKIKQHIKTFDIVFISVLAVVILYPLINIAIENIEARNAIDASRGSFGSGRSVFWLIVWDDFWKHDFIDIIFGNGIYSVNTLLKRTYGIAIASHNGWLDQLYNYGIIGFAIYFYTVFSMLKNNKYLSHPNTDYKNMLVIIFILFFTKSITSHGSWDVFVMPLGNTLSIIACSVFNKPIGQSYIKRKWISC